MDIFSVWTIGLVFFMSQVIYSVAGFGSGMFAISLLTLLYGRPDFFVPLLVLLCVPTELYVTVASLKKISFREHLWIYPGMVPALIAGTFALKYAAGKDILFLMGVIILASSIFSCLRFDRGRVRKKSAFASFLVGLSSGVLGGMFGIAGPPLVMYFQYLNLEKSEFRASLLSIFLIMSLMRISVYAAQSMITSVHIYWLVAVLPFSVAGLVAGNLLHRKVPEGHFKALVSMLLLILSLSLIINNFPG